MSEEQGYPRAVITEKVSPASAERTTDSERQQIIANAFSKKQEEGGSREESFSQSAPIPKPQENSEQAKEIEAQTEEQEAELQKKERGETQENDEFASKFAALSRKEKAMREQEQTLQQKMQELEARQKEMEEKYGKYEGLDTKIKERPLDVLTEHGVDFETLAKMVLENDGKPTTEMEIQRLREDMENKYMKEIENLRSELTEKEQKQQEQKYQEVIEDFKHELNEHVEQNADNYELIKLNDASSLVYEVVEEHYNETGRVLSHEEACDHVENYLLEEAKKHLNVNKIKSLLGQQEPEAPSKQQAPQQTAVNTLSNTESATVPQQNSRFMSEEESKREAAKLIKWVE